MLFLEAARAHTIVWCTSLQEVVETAASVSRLRFFVVCMPLVGAQQHDKWLDWLGLFRYIIDPKF
jgi:hypothetical protein